MCTPGKATHFALKYMIKESGRGTMIRTASDDGVSFSVIYLGCNWLTKIDAVVPPMLAPLNGGHGLSVADYD